MVFKIEKERRKMKKKGSAKGKKGGEEEVKDKERGAR
jgi:hypothetical protein